MLALIIVLVLSSPFTSEQLICPQTENYALKYSQFSNSLCSGIQTSVGNWFLNAIKVFEFSFAFDVKFFFDASRWMVVPQILNGGAIDPWEDKHCMKHPPTTSNNTLVFNDGWLSLNSTLLLRLGPIIANATSMRSFFELAQQRLKYSTEERLLCKFSGVFSRGPILAEHLKRKGHEGRPYVAMHIRRKTAVDSDFFGCDTKTNCKHILTGNPDVVCREWLKFSAEHSDEIPNTIEKLIFLISSDNALKQSCLELSNNTLLTFESPFQSHTRFGTMASSISAFADFFAMMDARVLIRGKSSFSFMVQHLKFLPHECKSILDSGNYKTICAKHF